MRCHSRPGREKTKPKKAFDFISTTKNIECAPGLAGSTSSVTLRAGWLAGGGSIWIFPDQQQERELACVAAFCVRVLRETNFFSFFFPGQVCCCRHWIFDFRRRGSTGFQQEVFGFESKLEDWPASCWCCAQDTPPNRFLGVGGWGAATRLARYCGVSRPS